MFKSLITMFTLASLARSACHSINDVGGEMTAMCVDEDHGVPFEYSWDNPAKYRAFSKHRTTNKVLRLIYEDYLNGTGVVERHIDETNEKSLGKFTLKNRFKNCKQGLAGVCANDHVISWSGNAGVFIGAVAGILAAVNTGKREDESPRSKCIHYDHAGTICLSWAFYQIGRATKAQLQDISKDCWHDCQARNYSCEVMLINDDRAQYFCVSNRATGCAANPDLTGVC